MRYWLLRIGVLCALAVFCGSMAVAQEVVFKDPTGDDNGPGTYTYPTDGVYKAGSFDITELKIKADGSKLNIDVAMNTALEDPWRMGCGFAVQMIFVFIKTGTEGGFTKGLPGLNVEFAATDGWDRCVILSPQPSSRVKNEVEAKVAKDLAAAVLVPTRTRGAGRTISASVDMKDVGTGDVTKWKYQVLMQSNEGFPAATDLLTRKVNEYEGQHRFGGGNDGECDPHVMDLLAGDAVGDKSEIEAQHKMLAYECNPDGTAKTMATLTMVQKK